MAGGGTTQLAAHKIRDKVCRIAAPLMDAAPEELEIGAGNIYLRKAPERTFPLKEIARMAHLTPHQLPEGEEAGLEVTQHYDPPPVTFANSAHVALVEVDSRTGQVCLLRYAVVEDCGNRINPMIVEGQVQGGVSHGIGNVLYEELAYNEDGQLLTPPLWITWFQRHWRFRISRSNTWSHHRPLPWGGSRGWGKAAPLLLQRPSSMGWSMPYRLWE